MKPRVLVTDSSNGQNRAALAAVRALADAGYAVTVATSSGDSLAAASRSCSESVRVPPVGDSAFVPAVRAELDRTPYAGVFAGNDAALAALDLAPLELLDKARIGERAAQAGFEPLREQQFESAEELRAARMQLDYPAVVKPLVKLLGSEQPAFKVESAAELERVQPVGAVLVQQWTPLPMRAIAGVIRDGRLTAVVHQRYVRTWPVACGVASAAVTVGPSIDDEPRLERLLGGFEGVFQAQLLGPHLIDLNARVYGSLPLAVAAGANLPAIALDRSPVTAGAPIRARPGVHYRWLEGDVRSVLAGVRDRSIGVFGAAAALAPRRGTAHSVESLHDPRPLVTRVSYAMRTRYGR